MTEPALTAQEWAAQNDGEAEPFAVRGSYEISREHHNDGLRLNGEWVPATTLPALIAFANAALSDSDPRKITRDWLRTLRSEAKYVGSGGLESEYEDEPYRSMGQREAALRAIADALESYLPPEPK